MFQLKGSIFTHPKRVFLLVSVLIAALAVATFAHFASLPPRTGPIVSFTSFPFELSSGLDKIEYASDENITVEFCLKNIGNTTLRMMKSYSWGADPSVVSTESVGARTQPSEGGVDHLFHFGLALAYGNGTVILRVSKGIMATVYDILLEPNGYIKQTLKFGRSWGLTPLQAGTYEIRAIFEAGLNRTSSITLETPSIGFGIR